MRTMLVFGAVLAAMTACSKVATSPGVPSSATARPSPFMTPARAANWSRRGGERAFQDLAQLYPDFGGFFYSSPGSDTIVVTMAGEAHAASVVGAVLGILQAKRPITPPIVVGRQVRFTFLELDAWRDSVEDKLLAIQTVTMIDNDEQQNRLTIGTEPGSDRSAIITVMRAAQIPPEAYRFIDYIGCRHFKCQLDDTVTSPLPTGNTLQTYHRPAQGGMRVSFFPGDGVEHACTMTMTGYDWNLGNPPGHDLGIVTNSHCSRLFMTNDGTRYYQPDSASEKASGSGLFAVETDDPAYTAGASGINRRSDALFATAGNGGQIANKLIARPNGLVNTHNLNLGSAAPWTIIDTDGPTANGRTDKVGQKTGWSSGTTSFTCTTLPSDSSPSVSLNCQTGFSNMLSDRGDSGSPMFRSSTLGGDPANSTGVTLVAILWGRDGNGYTLASTWFDVGADFRAIDTVPPNP